MAISCRPAGSSLGFASLRETCAHLDSVRPPQGRGQGGDCYVHTVAQWPMIAGLAALLCIASAGCDGGGGNGGGGGGGGGGTPPALTFADAFPGRSFSNPVKLVQHPTTDTRWYVVEQGGLVKTFLSTNSTAPTTAANVANADAAFVSGGEQGLLGMAFDPNFATSGEAYFTYTRSGTSILARWVSSDGGLTFTQDSAPVVLAIGHPFANHNGGDIMFGRDGFLYYSMGDGGGADDPNNYGQNRNILLGKILRIDVNSAQGSDSYAIPTDNPFAGGAHCNNLSTPGTLPCPEIWALGFRNPWRMNFDPSTGVLYVGDVGQSTQEEIDIVTRGANYGWDCLEGTASHSTTASCNFASFTAPEVVHGRSEARAITGGAVYRGSVVPGLRGFYVYGDFLSQLFFAFDTTVADAPSLRLSVPAASVTAFGQGRDGEVYVVSFGTPSIQKFVPGSG